jgi:hypothetical protein
MTSIQVTIDINTDILQNHVLNDTNTVLTTITNHGYLLYTLNMLKSLQSYGLDKKILIVCFDTKSEKVLKQKGYSTILIDIKLSKLISYNKTGYDVICYYKLLFIYKTIQLGYNIFYIDGDIIFKKNPISDLNIWLDSDKDIYIQNDSMTNNNHSNLCMGLLMVKSTNNSIKYFKCDTPETIEFYNKYCAMDNNDQTYFNKIIKNNIKVGVMELEKFPNGNYFYKNHETIINSLYGVHFNWVHGHEKLLRMKNYGMWYLTEDEEDI